MDRNLHAPDIEAADDAAGLRRMRRIATALLVAMAVLFLLARTYEPGHAWIGFVRAFAEAAMIGALADWFAVTALFRHPLGLPIPHTAIVPRNKDRIGAGLGRFVEQNFLAPEIVAEKLAGTDLAGGLARWLRQGENATLVATRIVRLLPAALNAAADDDIRRLLRETITARLRKIELAPLAGNVLALLTAQGRHRAIVDVLLREAAVLLRENEPEIRRRVREKTAWLWQKLGVDERVSDKFIEVAEETIGELGRDPDHELRSRADQTIERLAAELKTSATLRLEGEALKERLLEHPALAAYLGALWDDIRAWIATDGGASHPALRDRLANVIASTGDTVLVDEGIRRKLNRLLRGAILEVVASQRHEVGRLIAGTVARWDADTFSGRIEAAIGRDLQYIRINGTLVGGLVGVLIHLVSTRLLP